LDPVAQRGEVLSTVNKRLAVILLAFGGQLCRETPIGWYDVYRDVNAFIDGEPPPRQVISFNFVATKFLKDLAAAYESKDKQAFPALLGELLTRDDRERAVLALDVFREVVAAGQLLVGLLFQMPDGAKWDAIGDVRLGKNSSNELRAEFLSKV
jgi:hypothetical protein